MPIYFNTYAGLPWYVARTYANLQRGITSILFAAVPLRAANDANHAE